MNRIHTTALTAEQKRDIKRLTDVCRHEEPLTLSAPLEEGLEYFLLYDDVRLLSMLFLFFPEEAVCECAAFTHPSYRQNGYFTVLLDDALDFIDDYEETHNLQTDFCFLSDGLSPAAASALQALGAEYWYSEYGMERTLSEDDRLCQATLPLSVEDAGDHLYTAALRDQVIGVCMVIPNGDCVYLYGFEIKEAYRHKGCGQNFLLGMLSLLSYDYRRISLQVSGRNTAALSLYRRTGFHITETLSYYLY